MKKIINNKLYDTSTAKPVGTYANGGSWRDFQHLEETLYRKKTGEFFLHGEGGPMTRYAVATGQNAWQDGARIMPMTYQEAQSWAEEHLTADEYEATFGAVAEDDSRVTMSISISATAAETAKRKAGKAGIGISAYIEALILAKTK